MRKPSSWPIAPSAAEIVRIVFRSSTLREYTGGSNGLTEFANGFYALNPLPRGTYGFGPWRFGERLTWMLIVGWVLVALCVLVAALPLAARGADAVVSRCLTWWRTLPRRASVVRIGAVALVAIIAVPAISKKRQETFVED